MFMLISIIHILFVTIQSLDASQPLDLHNFDIRVPRCEQPGIDKKKQSASNKDS